MKELKASVLKAVMALVVNPRVRASACYPHPKLSIVATRRGRGCCNRGHIEMVVTIGRPNDLGRKFVKDCIKAGEKFPVRKAQLKFYPEKRNSRKS